MANNFVYVFHKKPPSRFSWVAEIRSQIENSNRTPLQFTVKMRSHANKKKKGKVVGQTIYATIPYINQDIPIVILFRALNCMSDKEILDRICFDSKDKLMMEALRPSLEEGAPYQTPEAALSYIGSRGAAGGASREKRIIYGTEILQKNFLPHISILPNCDVQKAYFVGYMVYRLINAHLGRAHEDDRDHYGKKRLDMAGSLLGSLFRSLFRKYTMDAQKLLKEKADKGDDLNITRAFKKDTISDGLRYALATGNWGHNRSGEVLKTGVS